MKFINLSIDTLKTQLKDERDESNLNAIILSLIFR